MHAKVINLIDPKRLPSLEAMIDGQMHPVIRIRLYALVQDWRWLESALTKSTIEQWALPLEGTGKVSGSIQAIDGRRHVITVGLPRAEAVDTVKSDIGKGLYDVLCSSCMVGYKKTRYTFTSTEGVAPWAVDVYMKNGGADSMWVKIDLEVSDLNMELPALPFHTDELILANSTALTPDQEDRIERLWSAEWQVIDPTRLQASAQGQQ